MSSYVSFFISSNNEMDLEGYYAFNKKPPETLTLVISSGLKLIELSAPSPEVGKHPDLMVGPPTSTVFPTNDRKFEISQLFRKKFEKI